MHFCVLYVYINMRQWPKKNDSQSMHNFQFSINFHSISLGLEEKWSERDTDNKKNYFIIL